MIRFRQSWPWWRWVLTGLSALALALSAYLAWHDLLGGSVIGCSAGSPCDRVLSSRWSAIGGVLPVSGLASGVYLAMLIASLFIGPATETPVRRLAWGAMLILVGAAAGSAVWFTVVQQWVIGAFCPYCMATHVTGLLLAALVIRRALIGNDECGMMNDEWKWHRRLSRGRFCRLIHHSSFIIPHFLVGLALAGVLAACQIGITPPAVYRGGESQDNLPAIDPRAVPLVGSPGALYVVTLLFDYQCPHCQQMHFMLDEAVRRYGGKLAFALCPAPLESKCNRYIAQDVEEFKDSCELAKIGLAVWVAKREAFPAFDRWMFSLESGDRWRPRSLDATRAKAVELVGQAKFEAALADPWIAQYLQDSIEIFGNTVGSSNTIQSRNAVNAVPKLVFGSRWVIPAPYSADDLVLILQDSLAVPKP